MTDDPDAPATPGVVLAVIVTYNSSSVVGDLLDGLPTAFGDVPYYVVVVDNGSCDGTVELLRNRADCQLVESTNRGYAAGINLGIDSGPAAPYALVLNPDVRMAPDSVPPLLAAARQPNVGIAVPRVLNPDGTLFRSLRREPTLARALGLTRTNLAALSEYVSEPHAYEFSHETDWALGAVMLVSRHTHQVLGGWDESFFLYSEETDLCLRARDLGLMTWYEPRSEVVHIGGQSGRSSAIHTMQIINRVRLYRRRHGHVASYAYYLLTILSELSWVARGSARSATAVRALIQQSRRPAELGASDRLVPT